MGLLRLMQSHRAGRTTHDEAAFEGAELARGAAPSPDLLEEFRSVAELLGPLADANDPDGHLLLLGWWNEALLRAPNGTWVEGEQERAALSDALLRWAEHSDDPWPVIVLVPPDEQVIDLALRSWGGLDPGADQWWPRALDVFRALVQARSEAEAISWLRSQVPDRPAAVWAADLADIAAPYPFMETPDQWPVVDREAGLWACRCAVRDWATLSESARIRVAAAAFRLGDGELFAECSTAVAGPPPGNDHSDPPLGAYGTLAWLDHVSGLSALAHRHARDWFATEQPPGSGAQSVAAGLVLSTCLSDPVEQRGQIDGAAGVALRIGFGPLLSTVLHRRAEILSALGDHVGAMASLALAVHESPPRLSVGKWHHAGAWFDVGHVQYGALSDEALRRSYAELERVAGVPSREAVVEQFNYLWGCGPPRGGPGTDQSAPSPGTPG